MTFIDNWKQILKRSYTLWLTYIMLGSGMVVAAIHEAGDGTLPEALRVWLVLWLTRVIFVCTILQIPARILKQSIPADRE